MAIVEVVKYDGPSGVFAWKYPHQELATWSQLVVNEAQEAVLFKGGKAMDAFSAGRHTLDTQNIPILVEFLKLPFGGKSPFTAEVWFINKAYSLDIKWGTPTPIQIQDPKYGVFIPVSAFGQFGIRIADGIAFLTKLVGTLSAFDKETIVQYFRGLYITKVKDAISTYLLKKKISVLEINAYIDELSEYLKEQIAPALSEYGIELVNFYVNNISVPEDDSAVIKLKEALSKKAEMEIVGFDYQQQRSFDTLEGAAKNPGSGAATMMGAGVGMGMGVGMGSAMGQQMAGVTGVMNVNGKGNEKSAVKCSKCGAALEPNAKFCPECGDPYHPCPKCGADIPTGANQCPECGYALPAPCPKCGAAIEKAGTKFCPECGESLQKACPKCGTEVQAGVKFCPECGEKISNGENGKEE